MAKILVADDNSNVQKTVALALAELGVEVASVNNGEAAVRKLPGFLPDLVLADIFMPVRNGYEVCEFVKNDPRFSHVPVVLLVGAFDPLDEREAQRVGADGILKKPFVPPEPLITMVKALLDRVGERLVSVHANPQVHAAKVATERSDSAPVSVTYPETSEEPTPEFPPPHGRIQFGEGERPIAFGGLLGIAIEEVGATNSAQIQPIEPVVESAVFAPPDVEPAVELIDNEQILTSARDANLGDPIFWKNDSAEPEAEAESSEEVPAATLSTDLGLAWKNGEIAPANRVEVEADLLQPVDPLELIHEEQVEALPTVADSESILVDIAAQSDLSVESHKPEDLAANPLEWMATAPPLQSETAPDTTPELDEPIPVSTDSIDHEETSIPTEVMAETLIERKDEVPVHASTQVSEGTMQEIPAPRPVLVPIVEETAAPVADPTPVLAAADPAIPEPHASVQEKPEIPVTVAAQRTTDTARSIPKQDWAALTASLGLQATEEVSALKQAEALRNAQAPAPSNTTSAPAAGLNGQSGSPDPALVEAVVQRVLEKMRPQVVDIITKEFLRPIVQALVHREIEKR